MLLEARKRSKVQASQVISAKEIPDLSATKVSLPTNHTISESRPRRGGSRGYKTPENPTQVSSHVLIKENNGNDETGPLAGL